MAPLSGRGTNVLFRTSAEPATVSSGVGPLVREMLFEALMGSAA